MRSGTFPHGSYLVYIYIYRYTRCNGVTARSETASGSRNGRDALDVEKQRAGNTTRQQGRVRAQDTTPKTRRKSRKHRSKKLGTTTPDRTKNSENRPRNHLKSTSGRSWAAWSDQVRSRDGDGRAQDRPRAPRDAPGTAQERSWQRPGTPRRIPKRVETAPGTLLWAVEAATERARNAEPWRKRSADEF